MEKKVQKMYVDHHWVNASISELHQKSIIPESLIKCPSLFTLFCFLSCPLPHWPLVLQRFGGFFPDCFLTFWIGAMLEWLIIVKMYSGIVKSIIPTFIPHILNFHPVSIASCIYIQNFFFLWDCLEKDIIYLKELSTQKSLNLIPFIP